MKIGDFIQKSNNLYLGIDVGSTSVCTIILDKNGDILFEDYRRISGQPLATVANVLEKIEADFSFEDIVSLSFTGSGGKAFLPILGGDFINEIIAHGRAVAHFYPKVRTVIEIGGEDSKLIFLSPSPDGYPRIVDFAMNTLCAAGTGAFLDQQAHRLGISIEEFSRLALEASYPARIAGRCAVFAKSDMIHLQQEATPLPEIVAGLCYALARNLKSNIGRGKPFLKPIAFQGGVAANLGMRRAFCDILHLSEGELIIPEHFLTMGAIGAALWALERKRENYVFPGIDKLYEAIEKRRRERRSWPPLELKRSLFKKVFSPISINKGGKVRAYLGIDIGSISTNLVVLDEEKRLLCKKYLMTAGRPLEAVKRGLKEIGEELGDRLEIVGVCTTGSGRFLVGDFVGADIIKNEITAQAEAAVEIYPEVDTVFEIGGQDSKFIRLENGTVVDFQMNSACAAGTGSFLEEQAEGLGVSIAGEFGDLALSAKCPAPLGERCTVFMKSDLVHYQQRGTSKEDLVAGLCYAIAQNYLNKVVGNRKIGKNILFQGGVAANKGVVAAFERLLGKSIVVPEHHEVTGAIGAALLAMKERNWEKTRFKGFELAHVRYSINTFVCKACPNRCEIKKVSIEGDKPLFYGGRCEKYEVSRRDYKIRGVLNLVKERNDLVRRYSKIEEGGTIGIPMVFFFHDLLPFFSTLLKGLGFGAVTSDPTTKETVKEGIETVIAETCYPVKVAHGQVSNLIKRGIKYIFVPSIIDLPPIHKEFSLGMLCPYVEALPHMLKAAFPFKKLGVKLIDPVLYLGRKGWYRKESIRNIAKSLKVSTKEVERAWEEAEIVQSEYQRALRERGRAVLERLKDGDIAIVIVGRPYNSFDDGVNLRIPQKLAKRGVTVLPLDALPLSEIKEIDYMKDFYWHYGQNILSAAKIIREDKRLYAVYITNFACGPDSFILHFFREQMQGKPFLEIEIDEHSADAGIVTRLEAFLDSIKGRKRPPSEERKISILRYSRYERRVYIPYMCDHAFALQAVFEGCGVPAKVLPPSDERSLELGRSLSSGKECYPCILTTGDMVKMTQMPDFDPKHSAFFMPSGSGPCRFGQYHRFQRIVLDKLGYPEVPIYSPNQDGSHYEELGMVANDFIRWSWKGLVSVDLLSQLLRTTRPYEENPGETERVYRDSLNEICHCLREKREPTMVLEGIVKKFKEIPKTEKKRPPIGIVGEIYIRFNPFANEDIVKQIEDLGGEVWMPPFGEWIFYTNHTAILRVWRQRYVKRLLRLLFINFIQHKEEHKLRSALRSGLRDGKEPFIFRMLSWAKPYLDPAFEGEAILSIGKTIDFLRKGAVGIINVMPFTCMPGTIVQAILKRVKEEHGNFPCLNLIFDGQGKTNIQTRLEAFMHQVQQFYKSQFD